MSATLGHTLKDASNDPYDVFVSYRWKDPDETWVRHQLAPALRQSGLKICLDIEDFVPGRDVLLEMERAGKESKRVLCVLSPNYFEGNRFVRFESQMARRSDPGGSDGRLVPLILSRCPLPEWIRGLVAIDWTRSSGRQREWRKLLRALEAPNGNSPSPSGVDEPFVADLVSLSERVFDVEQADRIVKQARQFGQQQAVVADLRNILSRTDDPIERYWLYIALGSIGGAEAHEIITRGLSDPNPFAQEGARHALGQLSVETPKFPESTEG